MSFEKEKDSAQKIAIPFSRVLFLFRTRFLSALIFVLTGSLVLGLWREFAVPVTLQGVALGDEAVVRSPKQGWIRDPVVWSAAVKEGVPLAWLYPLEPEKLALEKERFHSGVQLENALQSPFLALQENLLDLDRLRLDVQQTKAGLARDRIRLDFLLREGERVQTLWEDQIATQSQFEEIEADIARAEIGVQDGETRIVMLQSILEALSLSDDERTDWTQLRQTLQQVRDLEWNALKLASEPVPIVAPLSGVVTRHHVHPGTVVLAGDPLFTLEVEMADRVIAYMPTDARKLPEIGTKVWVYRYTPRDAVEGTIVRVGPGVQGIPDRFAPASLGIGRHAIPLRIRLDNREEFLPGESLFVRLQKRDV